MAMRMPSFSLIFSIRATYCSTRGATFSFSSASAGCAASTSAEGRTPSNLQSAHDRSSNLNADYYDGSLQFCWPADTEATHVCRCSFMYTRFPYH